MRSSLPVLVAIALLVGGALCPDGAEAQRRRGRRGRPGRAATEQAAEPGAPAEEPVADDAAPGPAEPPPPSPSSAPVATPAPVASAPPVAAADPGPAPPDLAPLRQEYVAILDEMVQARSRVAILGQELFRTRLSVAVQDRTGDEATLSRFVLELDGTPIHESQGEIEGGPEGRALFEGALAPGPHVLTFELEQRAREDTEYRVTQRESFRFVVVRERQTEVTIVLEDDSDIARAFPSGGEGRFEIRTRVRVATRALPGS
jgi:hypothetical protein